MLDREKRVLLCDCTLPVIIGNGLRAHLYATTLYLLYGLFPVVCGEHINLWSCLNFLCAFLQLPFHLHPRLAIEQLCDLTEDEPDRTALLLSGSRRGNDFIFSNERELEKHFVIVRSFTEIKKFLIAG